MHEQRRLHAEALAARRASVRPLVLVRGAVSLLCAHVCEPLAASVAAEAEFRAVRPRVAEERAVFGVDFGAVGAGVARTLAVDCSVVVAEIVRVCRLGLAVAAYPRVAVPTFEVGGGDNAAVFVLFGVADA